MNSLLRLLSIFAVALLAWGVDPTGAVVGSITDPSGRTMPGAEVSIRNRGTNAVRRTVTGASGEYSVRLLPPAHYEITAEAPNFRRMAYESVDVEVNRTVRIDFQLEIGDLLQSINVTTAGPMVQADSSTIGEVIATREIQSLPLNERNFLAFALLTPGAQLPADGSQSASNGASVSVNGGREQSNNMLLDGVDNNDLAINTYTVLPPASAVDQFQVQSSTSSAEFGRSGGAQINVVIKSGTNHLHGSVFGFIRNRHLDARNYFDKPACTPQSAPGTCGEIPRLDRSQFGGTLGGPIRRDKTFFFGAYEGLRLRQGITREATVPSQAQRETTGAAVPPSIRNPAGVALLNLYPAANVGANLSTSNRYVAAPTLTKDLDQYLVKLTHVLSGTDILSGHYAISDGNGFDPYDQFFAFTNLPGYGVFTRNRGQNGAVNLMQGVGGRMANEARFGFNQLSAARQQQSQGTSYSKQLGFPEIVPDPAAQGYPNAVVAGFDSIGEPTNTPQDRTDTTLHFADTLAWRSGGGKHDIRVGADIRRIGVDLSLYLLARGQFQFTGITGSSLQDLVLGVPTFAIGVSGDPRTYVSTLAQGYFIQDDIRLHPRLTLNLGLRYEYNRPPVEKNDAFSSPNLAPAANTCTPKPGCQFVVAGTAGLSASTFSPDRNNFAPRIGFAWRPGRSNSTVVRSGYGIFYDVAILNMSVSSHFNPPFYEAFIYPNFGTNTIQDIIGPVGIPPPPLVNAIAEDFRDAYVQQWNFGVQHEISNTILDIAYVGSKGTRLTDRRNPNQPRPGGIPPYPGFGSWTYWESGSSSVYHSLQVHTKHRWSSGFSYLASYTWSKSIDNVSALFQTASDPGFPQDSLNMSAERGLSNFDTRHRFVLSHLYALPYGRGRRWLSERSFLGSIVGGWNLSGIWTVQSGRPFTVNRGVDQSGTGTSPLMPTDRPDLIADPFLAGPVAANPDPACRVTTSAGGRSPEAVRTPEHWFNPCAFAPAPGRFGTSGRNALIGPALRNVDISVSRDVRLGAENRLLQFRFEFFNVFNHPNFDIPDRIFDSLRFGAIRSSNGFGNKPPRQIQLSILLFF